LAANDAIPLFTGAASSNPFVGRAGAFARSLNRVYIATLPGLMVDEDVLGRSAGELLSAQAWAAMIREATGDLTLNPGDPDLFFAFNACYDAPATHGAARALAERMGRRLGYLLLALARGDAANRAARPDWDAAHWAHWARMERVIIAGGLWAGRLGEAALPAARAVLLDAGCPLAVERSPLGESLPLLGLARHAPPDTARMLLLDFGHTNVKRGAATYHGGELVTLATHPALPAAGVDTGPAEQAQDEAQTRWRWMAEFITDEWRQLDPAIPPKWTAIGLSLATHLEAGHPLARDGGAYSRLADLAPHLATFLRDELAARLGPFRAFALLHDGLAAASAYAGAARTAVLVLGTAIGVGYASAVAGGLRMVRR
jgi:hypothetical protein